MSFTKNTLKGVFTPINPAKYIGNVSNIVFRSSWELRVMRFLDRNPNVLTWSSEELAIPYISPIDGKKHRYFPDFLIKVKGKNGEEKITLIEVKPLAQTREPSPKQKGQRTTKKFLREVKTFGVNDAKWKAARLYCAEKGWAFEIITEKELGIRP